MGEFITFLIIFIAIAIVVLTIYFGFKKTKNGNCLCGSCKSCNICSSQKEEN